MVRQLKTTYGVMRHEYEPSLETLWHIFETTMEYAPCSCISIVIDALDECDEKSRSFLLAKFLSMLRRHNQDGGKRSRIFKFLISAQPLVSRAWKTEDASLSQFHIDMEERPAGLVGDLQRFVDYKGGRPRSQCHLLQSNWRPAEAQPLHPS